ncbi:MAG TPA: GNAT family N-acetyltransferase [Chitinophagaceae bacterium]
MQAISITPRDEWKDYHVSTESAEMDIDMLHAYLSVESYWAKGIPKDILQRAIRHSLCFGVFHYNQQVGFARVISDQATFAYLADVFIIDSHRGKGLAKLMMGVIDAHPSLQGLRRWMLVTRDAHGLYKQFGWNAVPEEHHGRIMQRVNNYI